MNRPIPLTDIERRMLQFMLGSYVIDLQHAAQEVDLTTGQTNRLLVKLARLGLIEPAEPRRRVRVYRWKATEAGRRALASSHEEYGVTP